VQIAFHWGFVIVLSFAFVLSSICRARARKATGTIHRRDEAVIARAGLGLPLLLSFLAYAINPDWMDWSAIPIPDGLRGCGLAITAACVPFLWWVFASIGSNISETVLTKEHHHLVMTGPYRWIRHPLYGGVLLTFLSLGLVAPNGFMLGLVLLAATVFSTIVVPREEDKLIARFGEDYIAYRRRTGMAVPRIVGQQ
jgi:protein-S-isoprenylcysteine O-methyltransferase Ste14